MGMQKEISRFTLGTVQLGMNYGLANRTGQPSHAEAFHILDEAWRDGVRSLDTAVSYGESEGIIGQYLRSSGHPFFVVSKFVLRSGDPAEDLKRQVVQTREHLGTVDLYLFHNAGELREYGADVRPLLEELVRAGFAGRLGASVYDARDVELVLREDWLTAIQLPMSILDVRLLTDGLLEELHRKGMLIFVRSVFFQGLVCTEQIPERYAFLEPYLDQLREVARQEGMSLRELAVAFIRDLPGVTSVVLGCESAAQVADNSVTINCPSISERGRADILEIGARIPSGHAMDLILGKE